MSKKNKNSTKEKFSLLDVPVSEMAQMIDIFVRNDVFTPDEIRVMLGKKPRKKQTNSTLRV